MIIACNSELFYEPFTEIGGKDLMKGTVFNTAALLLHLSAYCSHKDRPRLAQSALRRCFSFNVYGGGITRSVPDAGSCEIMQLPRKRT